MGGALGVAGCEYTVMNTYYLPPVFFNDHTARDLPEEGVSEEVGRKGQRVVVEMDDAAFRDLYTDADYYCDRATAEQMREMGEGGLTTSARATLRALRKQNPDLCSAIDAELAAMRKRWMTR